jgi:hypothetical protein
VNYEIIDLQPATSATHMTAERTNISIGHDIPDHAKII